MMMWTRDVDHNISRFILKCISICYNLRIIIFNSALIKPPDLIVLELSMILGERLINNFIYRNP